MALRKSHLYSSLWQSCDQLRGGMDASQYKDYVLTLLFMKYVSDKYDEADDPYADITVPPGGSFTDMVALKGTKEIGDGINKVIGALADANDYLLKGVIDQADFNDESKLGRGKEMQDRLSKLVGIFEGLDFRANRAHGDDLLGDAYEYLMRHFATQSGKSKGQFYTPAEVSRIMAQVIGIGPDTKRHQTVHDPACGSGSLLIRAADQAPNGLTIYGQEMDVATWTMARMNMILHGRVAAELKRDNTLAAPQFTEGPGSLTRFDFAVANPPFSMKAWTNGFDPANDEFDRFEYGIPPAKNGDYAYLLHLVASLKSTGKGAIIMPHGVLFRGNREADIRRNLIQRGLIKGVIGLPANLFYGTGIPACIVLIDKENAVGRPGIFMINASKGFRKDGAKNRLRECDIHRIVDVFNGQKETPGYARMVPIAEIASETNDYNLNIPRYIDSSEPEDLHDLGAHLHGGIPNRDIDALDAYWKVFPALRRRLFAANSRERYSEARTPAEEVGAVVLGHDEFSAYRDRVQSAFDDWRLAHEPCLYGLGAGDSPKALIRELSEDLLGRLAGLPLLDPYDVYQCLMDYWDEVMQDDVYLVVTDGWVEAARPRVLAGGKGQAAESADLTVKRTKYRMDLLPPDLVAARYFADAQREAERLRTEQEGIELRLDAFVEGNTGEDGLLGGATTGAGNVTQAAVRTRLKEIRGGCGDPDERDALKVCLDLMKALGKAKRTAKKAKAKLDAEVLARYATLEPSDVADMVVRRKWVASIKFAIDRQVDGLTIGLVDRITVLEARYAEALPELVRQVEDHAEKVQSHLERMQRLMTGKTRLPGFQGEWDLTTFDQLLTHHSGDSRFIKGGLRSLPRQGFFPGFSASGQDVWLPTFTQTGDALVVSAVGSRCGRTFRASGKWTAIANTHVVWPIADRVSIDYLQLWLDDEAFWLKGGSGQPFVQFRDSFSREILLPPVPEQRAIAAVLSDMDAEIAALERRLDKTRALKQGMMQQLLSGSIRLPLPEVSAEGEPGR